MRSLVVGQFQIVILNGADNRECDYRRSEESELSGIPRPQILRGVYTEQSECAQNDKMYIVKLIHYPIFFLVNVPFGKRIFPLCSSPSAVLLILHRQPFDALLNVMEPPIFPFLPGKDAFFFRPDDMHAYGRRAIG